MASGVGGSLADDLGRGLSHDGVSRGCILRHGGAAQLGLGWRVFPLATIPVGAASLPRCLGPVELLTRERCA